jgi:hypothetical protein
VRDGSVLAKLSIPPVSLFIKLACLNSLVKNFEVFLSGRASNNLTNTRDQDIHCLDSLAVFIQLHVEGLDVLGIVEEDNGSIENFLSEVALMLRSEIYTPFNFVLELDLSILDFLLKDSDSFCVRYTAEWCLDDLVESFNETLLNELIEELEFIFVVCHHVLQTELQIVFCTLHVVLKGCEGQLWLNHPELRQVASSVGVLSTECGTESVDIRE